MLADHPQGKSNLRIAALVVAVTTMAVSTASAAGFTGKAPIRLRTTATEARAFAGPSKPMMLGGLSSKSWPVVVAIAGDLRQISYAAIGLDMTCTSGDQFALSDGVIRLPIAQNGNVAATRQIPAQPAVSGVSLTGGTQSFTGKLNRKRLTLRGTWRLHLDFQLADGTADHCDSGRVSFTAQH